MARIVALARPRKTLADVLTLPEGVWAQLIDGEVYVSPSPADVHQATVVALCVALDAHVRRTRDGAVFVAPFDVHLPTGEVVQPDVLWISRARREIVRTWVHGAPDLVVEVVSPGRVDRERIVKKALYERSGVREHWIADPATRSVEVFVLEGGTYHAGGWFTTGTRLVSPSLPGLLLPIDGLFPPSDDLFPPS